MTTNRDTPGVIAPPPLIYLGFLFVGWGLAQIGARPEAVEGGFRWLAAGFGLEMEIRRGVALALIVGGLLFDGMAAGLFRRRGTAVEPWKPSTALATAPRAWLRVAAAALKSCFSRSALGATGVQMR